MAKFLDGETLDRRASCAPALRRATIAMKVVPVLCGTAFKNKGVQPLLDAVVDYLPSPVDIPPIAGHRPRHAASRSTRQRRRRRAVRGAGVQDHDRPVRRAAHLLPRLLGHARGGLDVYNATKDKRERIGRLLQMHANKREEIKDVVRRRHRRRGRAARHAAPATRCATRSTPIILEPMQFPKPVISQAIEPKTKADQDKLGIALPAARRRGSDLPRAHRRGDRPDASSPAWASCTSRSSSTA